MLSARLVARRLSDVASNRYGIVSVDGILPTEVLAVAADTPALKVDCDTSFRAPLQPTPAEAMLRHGAYYMHTGEVFTTTPSCDATIDQAAMTYMRSAKCAAGLVKHHNLEQRVQWRSMLFGRLARAAAKPAGACLRAILVGVARMLATQIHSLDALSSESFKTLASNFDRVISRVKLSILKTF